MDRENARNQEVRRSEEARLFVITQQLAEEVPKDVANPRMIQPEHLDREGYDHERQESALPSALPGVGREIVGERNRHRGEVDGFSLQLRGEEHPYPRGARAVSAGEASP